MSCDCDTSVYHHVIYSQALKCVVLCIVLAPYDNEQSDLMHRIKNEKALEDVPTYRFVFNLPFFIPCSCYECSTCSV